MMPVPILPVTGALGAGKTTLINRLLREPGGRRLAAIVNDFGAIDIDADLLRGVCDGVVSLNNGCICCSLQMDLLSTLSALLRRAPAPDGIVIETSGVSHPTEIVRALLDPVVWAAAALDAVVTVVDAQDLASHPGRDGDVLWQAQIAAADFVVLAKTDLLDSREEAVARAALVPYKPDRLIYRATDGVLPAALLVPPVLDRPARATPLRRMVALPGFQSVVWTSVTPLSRARFQAVVERFASVLLRAKGMVLFADRPAALTLFQLVGCRATMGPAPAHLPRRLGARLVFIARSGTLNQEDLRHRLQDCRSPMAAPQVGHRHAAIPQ